jgi:hypothetical protein
MSQEPSLDNIDDALFRRVVDLPPGSQRWLKTAIQVIRTMPSASEPDDAEWELPQLPAATMADLQDEAEAPPARETPLPGGLEDVITGKARLEDQLKSYPELADELEGLGEVIDMLRDLGESRRKRGDQILREEILGQPPEGQPSDDEEDLT